MNKKLFGTLLLGSLLMGGTFVSCQDYDDDIKDLQAQIDSLKPLSQTVSSLESALNSVKGEVQTNINNAIGSLPADVKAALKDAADALAAAKTAQEAADAAKALAEAAGKITGVDEEAAKAIEWVKANSEKLVNVAALEKAINDAKAELQTAINAKADAATVEALTKTVNALKAKVDAITDNRLKSLVFQPEFYVDGIEAAEYTYLKYAALDADQDAYVGDMKNDKGNDVELMAKPFSSEYTVTQYYHLGNIVEKENVKPAKGTKAESDYVTAPVKPNEYHGTMKTAGVKDSVVYALNPSTAVVTKEQCMVIAKNVLAMSRAGEPAKFKVENAYAKNGYLTVVYTVDDVTKLITANKQEGQSVVNGLANTTVIELEVNVNDTIINSDWAAIYETAVQPVAIAWNETGMAKAKQTAKYCTEKVLAVDKDGKSVMAERFELYKNPYEALKQAYSLPIQYNDAAGFDLKPLLALHMRKMDLERIGQNDDSNDLHAAKDEEASGHIELSLAEAEARYGLTVSFAPVSYITEADGNKTQPSNYINPALGANGHIVAGTVTPKSAVEDGPFNALQGVSSVTKQPLVQVLVKKGNEVVLEGYIKMQIVRDSENKVTDPIDLGVKDYNCAGLKYAMTWSQASTIVLQNTMNMSKAEFDLNYKLLVNDEASDKCAVLFSEPKDDKKLAVKNTYAIITEVPDPLGTTNTVLQVALDKYAQQYIIEDLGGKADFIVKYIPKNLDSDKYAAEPGVFVRLHVEIKETPVLLNMKTKIREYWYKNGVGVNDASDYEKTTTDLNALRLNVNYPADNKNSFDTDAPQYEDGTTESAGFIRDIRNAFEVSGANNDVVLVNGTTAHGDTRVKKNTMFYFHPAINGTTFKGDEDGETYKLSVDNDFVICNKWIDGDGPEATAALMTPSPAHMHRSATAKLSHKIEKIGEKPLNYIETLAQTSKLDKGQGIFTNKTLYVSINGAPRVPVATLKQETGEIYYNHSDEAQQLLNATSYKAAKAKAYVGVYSWNACQDVLAVKDGVFPAYFLRPLDMSQPKDKLVTDATANGSIAKLADIVTFVDWRNEDITPAKNGWLLAYYGVNKITIDLSKITTNMNGYDINSKLLPAVTTKAKFSIVDDSNTVLADMDDATAEPTLYTKSFDLSSYDYAAAPSADVFTAALGNLNLKYVNNGLNVYDWSVKVPVTISYDWGNFNTYVIVKVVKTLGTE